MLKHHTDLGTDRCWCSTHNLLLHADSDLGAISARQDRIKIKSKIRSTLVNDAMMCAILHGPHRRFPRHATSDTYITRLPPHPIRRSGALSECRDRPPFPRDLHVRINNPTQLRYTPTSHTLQATVLMQSLRCKSRNALVCRLMICVSTRTISLFDIGKTDLMMCALLRLEMQDVDSPSPRSFVRALSRNFVISYFEYY